MRSHVLPNIIFFFLWNIKGDILRNVSVVVFLAIQWLPEFFKIYLFSAEESVVSIVEVFVYLIVYYIHLYQINCDKIF